mmetsp:Transcript_162423/g.520544  ORF Transcript_162423/g.520544 Transcript_162423/m.520544 type:complete len:226 (-) Transcript_162423:116-793(-)
MVRGDKATRMRIEVFGRDKDVHQASDAQHQAWGVVAVDEQSKYRHSEPDGLQRSTECRAEHDSSNSTTAEPRPHGRQMLLGHELTDKCLLDGLAPTIVESGQKTTDEHHDRAVPIAEERRQTEDESGTTTNDHVAQKQRLRMRRVPGVQSADHQPAEPFSDAVGGDDERQEEGVGVHLTEVRPQSRQHDREARTTTEHVVEEHQQPTGCVPQACEVLCLWCHPLI